MLSSIDRVTVPTRVTCSGPTVTRAWPQSMQPGTHLFIPDIPPLHTVTTHDHTTAVLPPLPSHLPRVGSRPLLPPNTLRGVGAAAGRGGGRVSGGRGRGPRQGAEVRAGGGVDVAGAQDGAGAAAGMTATAVAAPNGEREVRVVVNTSAILGIAVATSHSQRPPLATSSLPGPPHT